MVKKDKIGFPTREAAMDEIRRILETNFNTCKTVKPCRCYFDKKIGFWYLTSQVKIFSYIYK